MADPQDLEPDCPASPESHWFSNRETTPPDHEMTISPARAIEETLALLGCEAPAEDVRRHLAGRGLDVGADLIERVREELRHTPTCEGK